MENLKLSLELTSTQKQFMDADADEVLFGGAAGGGKSYGQLADALLFALRYPKSRQLILRRTFPELEHSLPPCSSIPRGRPVTGPRHTPGNS